MGRYILNTATGAASPAVYVKQGDKGYTLDFEIHNDFARARFFCCEITVPYLLR